MLLNTVAGRAIDFVPPGRFCLSARPVRTGQLEKPKVEDFRMLRTRQAIPGDLEV